MIPKRFAHATFDNFETHTDSQRQARAAVEAWLKNLNSGPMLALIGLQGTGKSHLLYSAVRKLTSEIEAMDAKERAFSRLPFPFAAPWYALADHLRYGDVITTPSGSRERSAHEIRAQLWGRDVVMLDEVRRTSGTEFDDSELAKFACHAYDNRIAVLITTNVSPLEQVMGPAAASRFAQVTVVGPDARQAA